MTSQEIALISAGAALGGTILGIFGAAGPDRLKDRRAARGQRDQAIAEMLSATADLISGIQTMSEQQRTVALDLSAVLIPRTNRFFAAVAALTLGQDKELASCGATGGEGVAGPGAREPAGTGGSRRHGDHAGRTR